MRVRKRGSEPGCGFAAVRMALITQNQSDAPQQGRHQANKTFHRLFELEDVDETGQLKDILDVFVDAAQHHVATGRFGSFEDAEQDA